MSTITKEQLRERAREKVKSLEFSITQTAFADSRAELEEELELARIALASLEAEAVAYIIQDADARSRGEKGILRYFANISDEDINEYEITVTQLYVAPPAPLSVPDEMTPKQASRAYCGEVRGYRDGWNACRASMLQGAERVTTDYKLPEGWVACSERMPGSQEWVIVFAKWANQQVLCWDDVANRWTDFEDQSYFPDMFSHWMPLPAAPQQEAKNV